MSNTGRQYPDGPLEPGMVYSPLAGRTRPDVLAAVESWAWPALGEVMHSILGGSDREPGPPYTHTIVPPEPIGEDEDGNLLYPEPGPAFTLADLDRSFEEMWAAPRHIPADCPCRACADG